MEQPAPPPPPAESPPPPPPREPALPPPGAAGVSTAGFWAGNGTAAADEEWNHISAFPLPAPRASARAAIPPRFLLSSGKLTVFEVVMKIADALESVGFDD